jgi:DNA-binding XRE family transcriptional regulator
MIHNEREYKISKAELGKFKTTIAELEQQTPAEPWMLELQRNAMQSTIEDLEAELLEYENLKTSAQTGAPIIFTLSSLDELPDALVRARIAKGWTQADLAARMGVKPQQVQNDEITNYQSASFARLTKIARVLGMELETATLQVA